MFRRLCISTLVLIGLAGIGASAASAQERLPLDLSGAIRSFDMASSNGLLAAEAQLPAVFARRTDRSTTLLSSLYVSTAAMQALDVHSTLKALGRGGVEQNPLVAPATRNTAAFVALKAGVAFSTVMAARHMSKRNKVAAVVTLVAVNSAYAMVIQHNYRVAARLR